EDFLNRLDKAFGDSDKITKAINKLNTIKQKNRYFREFLQDFEQTIFEAQGWGWDDQIKKSHLRTALNRELSDRLVFQDEPVGYEDFVSQLRRTSDKMNRGLGLTPQSTQTLNNKPNGDPMDWEPTQTIKIANIQRNVMRRTQPDRATWVSREDIDRRIEAGLCMRCGGRGHVIKNCSLLPAYNPNQRGKNLSSKPKVTAAPVPVDQEFEEVSGNRPERKFDLKKEWNRFEESMDCKPFIVNTFINDIVSTSTLIDTGCLSYGLCDSNFAQKNNLVRLKVNPREVVGFDGKIASSVNEVAVVDIDLDGHRQSKVFLYISQLGQYDIILGIYWIVSQDVRINGPRSEIGIRSTGIIVRSKDVVQKYRNTLKMQYTLVSAIAFRQLTKNHSRNKGVKVFAASLADINKSLAVKKRTDPSSVLLTHYI
ncbi:hypothetical protein GcM1_127001, partial [Golovinomyces cichoracearum]